MLFDNKKAGCGYSPGNIIQLGYRESSIVNRQFYIQLIAHLVL